MANFEEEGDFMKDTKAYGAYYPTIGELDTKVETEGEENEMLPYDQPHSLYSSDVELEENVVVEQPPVPKNENKRTSRQAPKDEIKAKVQPKKRETKRQEKER